MEKKNTGLKVTIVILIILVLGLGSYIIWDKVINKPVNDNSPVTNNNETKDEVREKSIVSSEINKLIKGLNGELDETGNNSYCTMHLASLIDEFDFFEGNDILDNISVEMYDCLHDVTLTNVVDNPFNGSAILTKEQYADYKKYFYKDLDLYDNMWTNYPLSGEDTDYMNSFYLKAKEYLNKEYRYGYSIGDGFAANQMTFELESIKKENNSYLIEIKANTKWNYNSIIKNGTEDGIMHYYKGVLKVEVVGEYLKYNPLVFSKVNN